ncbi:MAG: pyrroline-5-carboxylate reductase [Dialister invisus]
MSFGSKARHYPFCFGRNKSVPPEAVISVAAAVTAATLEAGLPEKTPVIRVMPNTPASVGGMTAITAGRYADEDFIETAKEIFSALGKAAVVSERQLDEMGALSGAGPGYVFVIIDALADAGVRAGLPRKLAVEAAAQTLYGAAKMVLETGKHPAELRDGVTSPGGTTIAGIHAMEARGIRAALMDAVMAALAKSDEMGRK